MPHKRNPINCEQICGLARIIRGYSVTALENITLWHERDISHSSTERIILPDATELLDYMLHKLCGILGDLFVYPENMLKDMVKSMGLIFSQHVLLTLIEKGMLRETAYDVVQKNAMRAWEEQVPFKSLIEKEAVVQERLTEAELDDCFNLAYHYTHVDDIFHRLGLDD